MIETETLQELDWQKVRQVVEQVNPALANIINQIDANKLPKLLIGMQK